MQSILSPFSSAETILLIIVLILFIVVVGLLVLLIRGTAKTYELTYPVYDYTVKRAEKRAQDILHNAMEKSREIIVEAELRGTKAIAKEKIEYKKAEEMYLARFNELATESETALKSIGVVAKEQAQAATETLSKQVSDMQQEFGNTRSALAEYSKNTHEQLESLIGSMRKVISDDLEKSDVAIREETKEIIKHMEESAQRIEESFSNQLAERIESAFKAAELSAKTYRKKQEDLIDAHILSLVEHTTARVLEKKLNLSDHADLVLRALKEAKKDNIF